MSILINSFRYILQGQEEGAPEFFGVIPNITAIIGAGSFTYDVAQHYINAPTEYALQNAPTTMNIDNAGLLTYTPTIEENIGSIKVIATNAIGNAESNIFSAIAQIDNTILIDDFNAASEPDWGITHGSTITVTPTYGVIVDYGVPEDTLRCVYLKSSNDSDWVTINRTNIIPEASWSDAVYIKLDMAVAQDASWYMKLYVTAGGTTYDIVLTPYEYVTGFFQNRTIRLSDISSSLNPEEITGLKIEQTGQWDNTLYINKFSLLREETVTPTVIFTTNAATNNTFEPGDSIELIFTIGALGILTGAVRLEYEIYNYLGIIVEQNEITLDGSSSYQVFPTATGTEYYEVIAYWVDSSGDRMEIKSCIEPTGSIQQRKGTYAVVISTITDSSALLDSLGYDTFFGLHLSHNNLAGLVGINWGMSAPRWTLVEPTEPTYIDGMAEWAYDVLQGPVGTTSSKRIQLLQMNIFKHLPTWVQANQSDPAPAMLDVEDFYRYVTDTVKTHKHRYPNMAPRIYNIFWEVDLNDPVTGIREPVYSAADVKEAYRRVSLIIEAEDPTALLCGPGPSSYIKHLGWVQDMADGDVFQHLDGYHGHGYNNAPPETGGVQQKTKDLKTLFTTEGLPNAPIYVTELGYQSQFGSSDLQSYQAKVHIRCAIILKGEGVDVYAPFYAYDFTNSDNSWGFTYNLDAGIPFGPTNTSPKSVVVAYSVCVKELEGSNPVRELTTYGTDIWCYIFNSIDNDPIIAIWTIGNNVVLDIDVGAVATVTVTDFMGHDSIESVSNETISYYITDAPVYIKGVTWAAVGGE